MAEVDTSSYQKPPALPVSKSLLDNVNQFQQTESNQLGISQQKLNQANQALGYMTRAMSSLGPDASKDQYLAVGQNAVKMGLVPPNMLSTYTERLAAAPSAKDFYNEFVTAAATHQQTIDYHLGQQTTFNTGQQTTPVAVSPKFGMRPTGLPIQNQIPPGTPVYDANNRPTFQGPTPPVAPPGIATNPGQRLPTTNQPVQQRRPMLPVGKGNLTNDGEVTGVDVQNTPTPNQQVQNRYPAPSGPSAGLPPMYDEGLKAYTQDQQTASGKMLAAKPAIQALPLMQSKGFLSGPLTDQFTKVVAGLKSTGLINIADNADPTAIRQEVVKKLAQYLSNSPVAQRSDAAQTLREAGSPNPNVQILPALIKLTKDSIQLDRIEALMPNAFKGNNYQDYIKHKGTFPQSINEKALTLDLEPEEKSKSLVDDMAKQLKSKSARDRNDAEKFFKTLRMAKDQGFYQ